MRLPHNDPRRTRTVDAADRVAYEQSAPVGNAERGASTGVASTHRAASPGRHTPELDVFERTSQARPVRIAARTDFAGAQAERAGVSLRGHRGGASSPAGAPGRGDASDRGDASGPRDSTSEAPSKSVAQRRREARFREAAEALRSGDRDRAVELLNQNAKEKGMTVVGLFGLEAMFTTLATLFPTPALATMMAAGFRSCDDIDGLGVMLAAVARVGAGRRAKRLRGALPRPPQKEIPARKRYRGELMNVNSQDAHADALAKKLGGRSRVRFSKDPRQQEFDVVSDAYIGEAKPAVKRLRSGFRVQAKEVFEAAKATGRKVYYHFDGEPGREVIDKLKEYSNRYGVEVVIDFAPL